MKLHSVKKSSVKRLNRLFALTRRTLGIAVNRFAKRQETTTNLECGGMTREDNLPDYIRHIVFVCKGNVCRSVMAEHIATTMAGNCELDFLEFRSRGLDVTVANPAEVNAIEVCRINGLDITGHRSLPLDDIEMSWADLVLVMEPGQSRELKRRYPLYSNKILLLPLYKNYKSLFLKSMSITDPYGCPIREFEKCFEDIEACLRGLFDQMAKAFNPAKGSF